MGQIEKIKKGMDKGVRKVNSLIQLFVSARDEAVEAKESAKDSIKELKEIISEADTTIKVCDRII